MSCLAQFEKHPFEILSAELHFKVCNGVGVNFTVLENRQTGERLLGSRHYTFQHSLIMSDQLLHSLLIEEFCAVGHGADQLICCLAQGENQIKGGRLHFKLHRRKGKSTQLQITRRRILQNKYDLKEWIASQFAPQLEFIHQFGKGNVLVCVCTERYFPHPSQQFTEARVTLQLR